MNQTILGYAMGSPEISRAPITMEEFELLKKTALFGDEDAKALRMSYDVLKDQVEAVLDVWYGFVASNPHLVFFFGDKAGGQPNSAYLEAVRKRFGQWILDTASTNYD